MQITYGQWLEEIERIKAENDFKYLTKKRCRQLYGWSWVMRQNYRYSSDPFTVKVTFHNPSVESFYRLKWG